MAGVGGAWRRRRRGRKKGRKKGRGCSGDCAGHGFLATAPTSPCRQGPSGILCLVAPFGWLPSPVLPGDPGPGARPGGQCRERGHSPGAGTGPPLSEAQPPASRTPARGRKPIEQPGARRAGSRPGAAVSPALEAPARHPCPQPQSISVTPGLRCPPMRAALGLPARSPGTRLRASVSLPPVLHQLWEPSWAGGLLHGSAQETPAMTTSKVIAV